MTGLVRFGFELQPVSFSVSCCLFTLVAFAYFECSRATRGTFYRKLRGKMRRKTLSMIVWASHAAQSLDDLFIVLHVFCCSFCGCCCQTIVTTCRHSHELYVLSNTSAQISQGLKFAYSSKASRGIGEVGGGDQWSIALPHSTRSSITVCGGVPSKVAITLNIA